jgi:membrane glycosyltransferase
LFGTTATLLFLPKFAALLPACRRGAQSFGGAPGLTASTFAEMVLSALLAPIRMLAHTQFVTAALVGWSIQWKSPPREDAEVDWLLAARRHGWYTLLGVLWAGGVYWLNPEYLWWLLPIVGALIVSIPLSVYTSRLSLGRRARRAGIFAIPEESQPPREIVRMRQFLQEAQAPPDFSAAVTDPVVNTLACAAAATHAQAAPLLRRERMRDAQRALSGGLQVLTAQQKLALLNDAALLSHLHEQVGNKPSGHSAATNRGGD